MDPQVHAGIANATDGNPVGLARLLHHEPSAKLLATGGIVIFSILIYGLNKLLTPARDSREPPLVKATIPWIGHILGIITMQSDYHQVIHAKHPTLPIVTLPMLGSKLYAAYDPFVINALLCQKKASTDHFSLEFAQKVFGLSGKVFAKITPELMDRFKAAIHTSFSEDMVSRMNMQTLGYIGEKLGSVTRGAAAIDEFNSGREKAIPGGIEVENLYLWIRHVMTMATTKGLYGASNPFSHRPELLDDIWNFEEAIPYFLLSLAPAITMPKQYQARRRLQQTLSRYYTEEHDVTDASTSQLVKNRAQAMRKNGWTGDEMGFTEMVLPSVSVLNTVPTTYWLLLWILQRPELLVRLREEAEAAVAVGKDGDTTVASIDVSQLDARHALLTSCYREAMRLVNNNLSSRRLTADATITTQDGTTYLLKKGFDLHLPAGVPHRDAAVWDNVASFDPERFLPDKTTKMTEADRTRKAAFIPFGGGRHLCPGRNFAFAEIIVFVSVVLLGFEIEPVGRGFGDVKMLGPQLASGSCKPDKAGRGLGARITVRKGWEDVDWQFKC